ncbi:serine/threonine protein phosphatase [Bradyrhizobium quebecense]|uniref:Serine/threonine protein phosphatase n=1 Tax=Bradyrhizobium quebecense TaxID=2748629 RepID=A0A974AKC4_9BRAD|nr:metallophosphoesterase family protein [Bradyrhizobium quebecense]UGA43023.1 serine/threonine protein phosphatase [Bradyrhizobium quebecense]
MILTYAIGDIHGCMVKLEELIRRCDNDAAGRPMRYVFLGDYVDRGPDSRSVVPFLMELQRAHTGRDIFLKGNHEDLLVAAADSDFFEDRWLDNGGVETLESYGVTSAAELPEDHVHWLRKLPLFFDDSRRFFVHAGVHPDRPLDRQDEDDLLWIRKRFLLSEREYGRLIVHGHTPLASWRPDLRANRLNLDTGAVFGGPLTAAVFEADETGPKGFIAAD